MTGRWAWMLIIVMGLAGGMAAQAQGGFQQPTEEELKMTSDPKYPGVDAIYLYREEIRDNFYARVKVLTEKGKELATLSLPRVVGEYKIVNIKARTIHADGTVIPLEVKPNDFIEGKEGGFRIDKVVFTLPSVEVGSILEYRWTKEMDEGYISPARWEIQQPYPVRKAHYEYDPDLRGDVTDAKGNMADHVLFASRLPDGVKVLHKPFGGFSLDVTDVPPAPKEEYMPPMERVNFHVYFYYSLYSSKDIFWKKEGEKWSRQMDKNAEETKVLKDAVEKIVSPADTEGQKARKLYDAVMAIENTDYTREKSKAERKAEHLKRAKGAEGVWQEKSGTSDEIALLYLAMARLAGLKAHAIQLTDRDRAVFDPFYLSLSQLDDVLVGVWIDGKETPLDPGKRMAPFGILASKHVNASGLQQTDNGATFVSMPVNSWKDAVTHRMADVTVATNGSVTGEMRISMRGPEGATWRERAIENDEDEVKKQFTEEVERTIPAGLTVEFDRFIGMPDFEAPLVAVLKFSGSIGTTTGKRTFLPGAFFASHGEHPFTANEKRETPVNVDYAEAVKDDVAFHVPEGVTVIGPPAANAAWTGFADFEIKSEIKPRLVTVSRVLVRGFAILEAKEYPELHGFYQKVAAADQQQVVLTKTAAGASAGTGK